MTQVRQVKALRDFGDGLYSTLVATSVAEEGLDIAECDLVVLYDAVPSEVRYIQRRGRVSRHHEGKVVTLITAGTLDETYYLSAVSKEKKMRDNISRMKEVETTRIEDFVFGVPHKGDETLDKEAKEPIGTINNMSTCNTSSRSMEDIFVNNIRVNDTPRKVIVDRSLENSKLLVRLRETGLDFSTRTTRGADIIIGDDIGIIYARYENLVKSNDAYKFLCQRVEVLKETFAVPLVLYETYDPDHPEMKGSGSELTHRITAYFILSKRVHFNVAKDDAEASDFINSIARVSLL